MGLLLRGEDKQEIIHVRQNARTQTRGAAATRGREILVRMKRRGHTMAPSPHHHMRITSRTTLRMSLVNQYGLMSQPIGIALT